ncbi:polyribonucleotide nucleotidyltransferase [Patescibacteria group bacterium]|nr:polyribonucleotide nucleotidyltransferase [Patescibacteria group bacterium]MBU1673029.1 polyribonucleotide nucleotidyltransferase [Patescibacteria group bacterium]MBU1963298.1 polyribonucleotide nucleotidyltransferase [Patescibacteria group bacterium]
MNEPKKFEMEWAGKKLILETGQMAPLTNASVRMQYGDTVVLVTACMGPEPRKDIDYFPLMVDYEEKMYAAGKISGSRFMKREGRPTDEAVLTGRVVDRSLRPLFSNEIRNDVQIVVTVLALDKETNQDIIALTGAAAALMISDIPWNGPLAGCTVGYINNDYVLNPTIEQIKESEINLTLAGRNGEVVMMEIDAQQSEDDKVAGAIEFGVKNLQPVVEFLEKIQKEIGKEKIDLKTFAAPEEEQKLKEEAIAKADPIIKEKIGSIFGLRSKIDRQNAENAIREDLKNALTEEEFGYAWEYFDQAFADEARKRLVEKDERVDGRKTDEIRDLSAVVGVLPRVHGSALFQRGETQILSIVTLGPPGAEQILDQMELEGTKRFMHHYNFPPFSVGEVSPMRGTGRREIGHGALAEKALEPVIPDKADFPYTIRVVSEVLASNGSSSQGSATCASMAMMNAGVPIKSPVAGIAMGLMSDLENPQKGYKILTDIQGVEDHAGDMDFKVAGTKNGVTAIQLDISNVQGISLEQCKQTLEQAKKARLEILEVTNKAISEPNKEMSEFAPRIETLKIDPERIGELIGPGGKIINEIIDTTGVEIDIEDDGTVFVTAVGGEDMKNGLKMIEDVLKVIEVGEEYEGTVEKIVTDRNSGAEIGAIVQLTPKDDGMVHISQVSYNRINKISDVIKPGELVKVKVMEVDKERGRIGLSIKELLPKPEGYQEDRRPSGPRKPYSPRQPRT